MAGLNLGRNTCYPDVIFLSRFRQKKDLCLKMGHDYCYMCFELNVRNSATVAMRHMRSQESVTEQIRQSLKCFLSHQVPEARSERRLPSRVTWALGTEGQVGAQSSAYQLH
jgi:hypothetical protein